jgi:hypothetical protein
MTREPPPPLRRLLPPLRLPPLRELFEDKGGSAEPTEPFAVDGADGCFPGLSTMRVALGFTPVPQRSTTGGASGYDFMSSEKLVGMAE